MTAATTKRKAAPRIGHASFARSVETSIEGEAPNAARLAKSGWNKTDKGDLNFTPRSAELVMAEYEERGNPLAWYYEHEDRIPLERRGGAPMKGVCSAPSSVLAVRDVDGTAELWAESIEWTAEARRQIVAGERRQLSPIWAFDEETREITGVLNVSLCAEGATHFGTILANRAGREQGNGMEELLSQLMSAIEAKDWELCENLIQQMEAMDGGAMMAKMGRYAVKCAKGEGDGEGDKPAGEVSTKKLAATKPNAAGMSALDDALKEMREATAEAKAAARRSDRATVSTLIAASRDYFDAVDEREHLQAANPEATRKFIASCQRKEKDGRLVLEASRQGGDKRPPRDEQKRDVTKDLTESDRRAIESFNRGKDPKFHITAEEYLNSKANQGAGSARGVA